MGIRSPWKCQNSEHFKENADCHTSDIGHWFAMTVLFAFSVSKCLLEQVPHLRCRLLLYLVGGVGVGGEGEACAAVTQHTGHGLDIDSVLQGKGGANRAPSGAEEAR